MSAGTDRRAAAEREILDTEKTYYARLTALHEVFVQGTSGVLSKKERAAVFLNIDELLLRSGLLLADLRAAQPGQAADIFLRHAPHLDCLLRYSVARGRASAFLSSLRQSRPELEKRLAELSDDPRTGGLDLSSLLHEPFQRLTRYAMMLRQVLHYTPRDDAHHEAVMRAVTAAERLATRANEDVRQAESRARLTELQEQITLTHSEVEALGRSFALVGLTRLNEPRLVLVEAETWLLGRSGKRKRALRVLVLSDMVLVLQPSADRRYYALYVLPIPIAEASAVFDANTSTLTLSHGTTSIVMAVDSQPDGNAIAQQVNRARECFLAGTAPQAGQGVPLAQCMGTVLVVARALRASAPIAGSVVLGLSLNGQRVEVPPVDATPAGADWGSTAVVLSMASYDDRLGVSLYSVTPYGPKRVLGRAEVSLDFLEYYGTRITEGYAVPVSGVGVLGIDLQFSPV